MKKKTHIQISWETHVRRSTPKDCSFDGILCLRRYIETLENQPYCLNCLRELGVLQNYKKKNLYAQPTMTMPRNYEVVRKDNGDTFKVYGFSFQGRKAFVLTEFGVVTFEDPRMDGNWTHEVWIIQPFTPRKHKKPEPLPIS